MGCTISGTINNGSISITELDSAITIRQLLGYIAEASGCSVKVDDSDHLCFMYYADSGITITADSYKELNTADYTCAAIDKVIIFDSAGMVQAQAGSGSNSLYIQNNPLLYSATNAHAQAILSQVSGFVYTPLTVDLFDEEGLEVGTAATFGGASTLVMHLESSEEGATVSAVGSDQRAAYNRSVAEMISAAVGEAVSVITDELGNIYQLSILTTYPDRSIVHTAQLLQNGVDIAPQTPSDFEWFYKLDDRLQYLGHGRSITIDQVHYGHSVTVTWVRRQYGNLLTNTGNKLMTNSGAYLIGRSEY
jgi:hypothetical protein